MGKSSTPSDQIVGVVCLVAISECCAQTRYMRNKLIGGAVLHHQPAPSLSRFDGSLSRRCVSKGFDVPLSSDSASWRYLYAGEAPTPFLRICVSVSVVAHPMILL